MIRAAKAPLRVGERYSLHEPIAAGGMAKVYYGRLHGMAGFSKLVAIKRIHGQGGAHEETSLLDEARLGARVAHPNVVQVLDVVESEGETFLVMEYVHGEPLSVVIRNAQTRGGVPPKIAATIVANALYGLHAAHEARNERGEPIGIVHMDVSPQNIMVGSDGIARLLDFGIATTRAALTTTTTRGQLKGKIGYMAPEQLEGGVPPSRRIDVYGAAVCLWEALTASRLFDGDSPAVMCVRILHERVAMPSSRAAGISPELDAVVMRGLSRDPAERYETALEMAAALERAIVPATPREIAAWLGEIVGPNLAARARTISGIESERRITTRALARMDSNPAPSSGTFTLDPAVVSARAQRVASAAPAMHSGPRSTLATLVARRASPSVLRLLFDWGPAIGIALLMLLAAWALLHGDGTANVLRTLRR